MKGFIPGAFLGEATPAGNSISFVTLITTRFTKWKLKKILKKDNVNTVIPENDTPVGPPTILVSVNLVF